MEKQQQKRFAIYSRKSRFTGKGESIENQIGLCREYIRRFYGESEAAEAAVYEDEGFSGGTLERPQFQAMMRDAGAGKFSAVVVYRLDRVSRSIGDFAGLIQELGDMKIAFLSIKEQFDTASPMGRAMMYIASVFSQLERETIAERIRDNMRELAKTGRWLGGITPTGFASESVERVSVDGRVRKACKLKMIPEEAELVRCIFRLYLDSGSLTGTETQLLCTGAVTKNGKAFTRFAIKGILTNPVYMTADADAFEYLRQQGAELFSHEREFDGTRGLMVYNRTEQTKGKTARIREMKEWVVAVGGHQGLISGAQWIRVQELLERNRSKGYRKPRSHDALLSGLLVCGGCGSYMRPKLTRRADAGGERIYTYLCSLKERSRGHCCAGPNAEGNLLDREVLAAVTSLAEDSGELCRLLEQIQRGLQSEGERGEAEQLRCRMEECVQERKGLVAALARAAGTSAEGCLIEKISELEERRVRLQGALSKLERQEETEALSGAEEERVLSVLCSLKSMEKYLSLEEKRELLRGCVKKVVWDGTQAHVFLWGAEEDRRGSAPLCEDSK